MKRGLLIFLFFATMATKAQTTYLALGDSYTIGERVLPSERWPVQLADSLNRKGWSIGSPTIIATTGWRTDDLKKAILAAHLKNEYGLVSLLIGVNNQYQGKPAAQYAVEFEDLLQTAIKLAGGKKEKVFVVSIPDYGFTPFGREKQDVISQQINEFNDINKRITLQYKIKYISITDISRKGLEDPALVASDGLHPSGKMYSLWVEQVAKALKD